MDMKYYRSVLENSPMGFSDHRIILDEKGNPIDYEYLNANSTFLEIFGLEGRDIVGSKASEVFPGIQEIDFGWISKYGEVAIHGGDITFEKYAVGYDSWFRVYSRGTGDGRFTSWIIDITDEKKDLEEKQALMASISDIILVIEENGIVRNLICFDESILFVPKEVIIGSTIQKLLPEKFAADVIASIRKAGISGDKEYLRYPSLNKKENKWFEACIQSTVLSDKKSFIVNINEITAQKQLETELKQKTDELERFFNINLDLLCIADLEGNFIKVNRAWERILGYTAKELESIKFLDFVHPDDMEATLDAMATLGQNEAVIDFVNRYRTPDGSYRYIEWRSQPYGEQIYAAARDITERIAADEKILYLSNHDQLTGLYNRHYYEQALKRTDSHVNLPLSLIMGDINGLKAANDRYGHLVGDKLIKKAAAIMKKECRAQDIICRIGGDEFVIILPKTNEVAAQALVARIENAMKKGKVGPVRLSAAFGVATKKFSREKIEELFKKAETEMYHKKTVVSAERRD